MLKRLPTRIELGPEDVMELSDVKKKSESKTRNRFQRGELDDKKMSRDSSPIIKIDDRSTGDRLGIDEQQLRFDE
eukprot:jgi/Bigna1/136861/aug1.36_g11569